MTSSGHPPHRPAARDDVVFRKTGDEWLLFDPATGRIHVLNLAAALLWASLDGSRSEEELATEVERAFPAGRGGARDLPREVTAALRRFREEGLLR